MVEIDSEVLSASLRRLSRQAEETDTEKVLQSAVEACVDLFNVTGSGLMLVDEQNTMRYVAASDGPGRLLEKLQADTGQGPCVQAFVDGQLVTTEDLATEPRWPRVSPVMARHGVRAALGAPVHLGGVPVGSLDVYQDTAYDWSPSEERALQRYSDVVAQILSAALSAQRAGELAAQLQYALDYRVVIERGVGYLMATQRVGAVEAFDLIRRTARSSRRKVGDVAKEVLATGSLPSA